VSVFCSASAGAAGDCTTSAGGSASNTAKGLAGFGLRCRLVRASPAAPHAGAPRRFLGARCKVCCRHTATWLASALPLACARCDSTTEEGTPQVGSRGSDEQGGVYERSMQRSGVDVSRLRVEDGSTGALEPAAQRPPMTLRQLPKCAWARVLSLAVPPGVHDADTYMQPSVIERDECEQAVAPGPSDASIFRVTIPASTG